MPARDARRTGRVVNLGSLNIDLVYRVPHLVRPGETISTRSVQRGAGGKGLNQSLALARAGAHVRHCGKIGADGEWLRDLLAKEGVDVSAVGTAAGLTGHAIVQVADTAENSILLVAGANHAINQADLRAALKDCGPADFFLAQNETSQVAEGLFIAKAAGMTVFFNPAPMADAVAEYPLDLVDYLVLNETEAAALSGPRRPRAMMKALSARWPKLKIVLTLGKAGALYYTQGEMIAVDAPRVKAIDTTAAGDVFIGYLIATIVAGTSPREALIRACAAAALSVTREGAAASIPTAREVSAFIKSEGASPLPVARR